MPYALSTTKRKFHSILDSISNPSSTSLNADNAQHYASTTATIPPPSSEPSAKKLKLARPTSTSKLSSSFASIRSASNRTTSSTASTMTEEKRPPNFAPWDRNQFLSRLETFRYVDRWVSKPDAINEVQWAKRGWRCVGKETVGCVGGCGSEVMISLEPSQEEQKPIEGLEPSEEAVDDYYDWREEAQKELVQRYTEMIVTEHDVGCLWRRKGCDDNIYRLPLAHQATTLRSLRDRYESLSAISSDLPSNISALENLNVSKLIPHLFHILYPNFQRARSDDHPSSPTITTGNPQAENVSHPTINPRALTLALLGWQTDQESTISGIATCTTCFRRLGLWLFKSPPSAPTTSPTQPSSPQSANSDKSPPATSPTFSARSDPIINRLDPIGEHRDYCPWINARSQSRNPSAVDLTEEDLPGWEILRNMVMHLRPPAGLRVPGTVEWNATPTGKADAEAVDAMAAKKTKEEKDKERWARLKKLKQVFKVRRKPKGVETQGVGTG
ncbi:MAG: hypothetical protein Q9181_003890 [Wetmoreana brouardii]